MNNRDYTWLTTLLTAARGIFEFQISYVCKCIEDYG